MITPKNPSGLNPVPDRRQDELLPTCAKDIDLIEKKRRQIVEGACRIFFKKGFHRTTIREIAASAGMSMGQLYHYISSKDDVLFLIYRHMQTIWCAHLVQSGIDDIEDPVEKFKEALRQTTAFMMKNRKLFLFIYTETKYLDKRHLRVVKEMDDQDVVGFWRKILREVNVEKPVWGDINLLANIVSYLMVFLPMRGWNMKENSPEDVANSLIDFILKGIGFDPEK